MGVTFLYAYKWSYIRECQKPLRRSNGEIFGLLFLSLKSQGFSVEIVNVELFLSIASDSSSVSSLLCNRDRLRLTNMRLHVPKWSTAIYCIDVGTFKT